MKSIWLGCGFYYSNKEFEYFLLTSSIVLIVLFSPSSSIKEREVISQGKRSPLIIIDEKKNDIYKRYRYVL